MEIPADIEIPSQQQQSNMLEVHSQAVQSHQAGKSNVLELHQLLAMQHFFLWEKKRRASGPSAIGALRPCVPDGD